MVIEGDEEITS